MKFGLIGRTAAFGLRWLRLACSRPAAAPAAGPPRRVLVLGYAAIGDLVFLLPALEALRRGWPGARVVFVANGGYPTTEELLPATGLADEIWRTEYPPGPLAREAARRVRREGFDAVLVSQATPIEAFGRALLSIPLRAGHLQPLDMPSAGWSWARRRLRRARRGIVTGEFERRRVFNRPVRLEDPEEHAVSRNLRLAAALGLPVPAAEAARPRVPEPEAARRFAEEAVPGREDRLTVGLHVGSPASQYAKVWPAAQWGRTCRLLGSKRPLRVVVVGGPEERPGAREFAEAFGGETTDLTGRCGLLESVAALKRCALVLAADTGLAKLAMAAGVPTATVWGPTSRAELGAVWDRERHLDVYHAVPCAPCVESGRPREGSGVITFADCGHRDCLSRLSPESAARAVAGKYRELF